MYVSHALTAALNLRALQPAIIASIERRCFPVSPPSPFPLAKLLVVARGPAGNSAIGVSSGVQPDMMMGYQGVVRSQKIGGSSDERKEN